jgi:osmotically inducible lipoprotein OsmB
MEDDRALSIRGSMSRKATSRGLKAMVAFAFVAAFAIAGCSGQPLSTREKGTLGGGVLGAGAGAIIGAAVGHPAAGAAIGGAFGAGTGYVVSNSMQNNENQQAQTQSQMQQQQRELEQQRQQIQQLQNQQQTE